MWFTVVTARRFISLSFQPCLAAARLRSGSVVNSPTPTGGTFTRVPASFAGAALYLVLPQAASNRRRVGRPGLQPVGWRCRRFIFGFTCLDQA